MGHAGMGMSQDMMDMMAGMPGWLVSIIILALCAISFLLVVWLNWRRTRQPQPFSTIDLLTLPLVSHAVKSRRFQFLLQLPVVLLFFVVIGAGLYGNQLASRNIAPILTWTIWWAGLIFIILFMGKLWCLICPWNAFAEWVERLSFWRKRTSTLSLGLKWPSGWRNIYIATGLFIGLTWLELGYGITFSPRATAYIGILMVVMAVVCAFVFERKSFCRYACLVGRVSGMYALFSPLELRSRDRDVCKTCRTHDCFAGNGKGYACPTFQYLRTMDENTYCILCTECVKTCPHGNVAVNLRPFGADLARQNGGQADEAYLVIVMVCLTIFHGLTMTPAWVYLTGFLKRAAGAGELGAFSIGMAGILLLPALLYTGAAWCAGRLAGRPGLLLKRAFITYAYPLLPVALFYHLAHNAEHFFMEGQKLIPLLSDPFGWGWNLFGTANLTPSSWLHLSTIWWMQAGLVLVGQAAGVAILVGIARRTFPTRGQALRSQVPVLLLMTACSLLNVWLMAQPMTMRTGM
ncbi:MAG: 4Fe-4S binding protein [Candidatus Latescibacteria bacterium]|nr:4Fe-4S binding protein [Candidatus Latescibacterota bacterium]